MNTKKYTREQATIVIDKSMTSFGLSLKMKTSPEIMSSILQEMNLNDFKTYNKVMNIFFKEIVTQPQALQPMFDNIKKGISSKHPAILEFAELALSKNWFKPSKKVIRSINVTYILEALTATMCNDHDFFVEVQNHYKSKEQKLGINTIHFFSTLVHALSISHDFFKLAKAFSLDPLMIYFKFQRGLSKSPITKKNLKKLYKENQINYLEYKLLSPIHKNEIANINELVRINIYEAGVTEYRNGFKANAISAHELSEILINKPPVTIFNNKQVIPENNADSFYNSITKKENTFPIIKLSQNWVSLYTSWNMTFVLGNLNNLDMVFPKLLIPSIINAESENFLGARFISLWLSINHIIFRNYKKIKITGPTNKGEMAKAWSEINKKYAFELANKETHENSKTLTRKYKRFFSHSFYNLFKIIKTFLK
jgi:hypothetical protein